VSIFEEKENETMEKRKVIKRIFGFAVLVGLLFSAIGCSSQEVNTPVEEPVTEPQLSGETEKEVVEEVVGFQPNIEGALARTSGKRFDGVTVVLAGVSGQVEFVGDAAKPWEEATGAKVELSITPMGDFPDKVAAGFAANTFVGDILNVPPYLAGDLMGAGFVEPVPDDVKERLDWEDVLPVFRINQTDWGGVTYGYPWDGDVHSLYYRTDLIEDSNKQEAFKSEFGYNLSAPTNWDQFFDQAKFFTGDWGDGRQHYGTTMLLMRKNHGIHGFVSIASSFAKMPDDPAFFFDPDTMEPRINNEGFVRALQYVVDLAPYMPSDAPNMDWMGNVQAYTSGLVAMDIQWADIGVMAYDPTISVVAGKVGYALTPGSMETFDARTGKWVEFEETNYAPYAAYGGWQNIVAANSQAKEAAIDLATYLSTPEIMLYASVTPGSGVNPARYSIMENTAAWLSVGFPNEEAVAEYLAIQQAVMEHPNTIFQLRIPGYIQYQDALELAISKALANQATPQEALDEAAAAWEEITDRIGRESQQKLYRESIGLMD